MICAVCVYDVHDSDENWEENGAVVGRGGGVLAMFVFRSCRGPTFIPTVASLRQAVHRTASDPTRPTSCGQSGTPYLTC